MDSQVQHGDEITLMVRADGLPRPELTWFLNGKEIVNAPELKMVVNAESQISSHLTITNYNEKDSGYVSIGQQNIDVVENICFSTKSLR